jgi:hypothetical protein
MAWYDLLIETVAAERTPSLTLSFDQIEQMTGTRLPPSARKYPAYWSKGNPLGDRMAKFGWRGPGAAARGAVVSILPYLDGVVCRKITRTSVSLCLVFGYVQKLGGWGAFLCSPLPMVLPEASHPGRWPCRRSPRLPERFFI